MAITNIQLVNYARGQLGRMYTYGTYGQRGTEQVYKEVLARYPDKVGKWPKYTYVEGYGQKWHDCAGLIKGAVWCNGEIEAVPKYDSKTDRSANGLIDCCVATGNADTVPNIPGLIMWKPGHVGIWTAQNGITIEAKGHMYGVVETKNTAWQMWGKLPKDYVIYEDTPTPTPDPGGKKIMLEVETLRKGSKGPEVYAIQCILKQKGYYTMNCDSSFGSGPEKAVKAYQSDNAATCGSADGIVGKKTWNSLINT